MKRDISFPAEGASESYKYIKMIQENNFWSIFHVICNCLKILVVIVVIVLSKVLLWDSGQSPLGSVGQGKVSKLFLFPSLWPSPQTISAQLAFVAVHAFDFLHPPVVGFSVGVFSFHHFKAAVRDAVSPESETTHRLLCCSKTYHSTTRCTIFCNHDSSLGNQNWA